MIKYMIILSEKIHVNEGYERACKKAHICNLRFSNEPVQLNYSSQEKKETKKKKFQ